MIDIDKYEGHTQEDWHFDSAHVLRNGYDKEIAELVGEDWLDDKATQALIEDAPLLLEFIQKIVKDWCKPNQCNQAFGKDVRQLMYEYGLITFNEETRRYEVKE